MELLMKIHQYEAPHGFLCLGNQIPAQLMLDDTLMHFSQPHVYIDNHMCVYPDTTTHSRVLSITECTLALQLTSQQIIAI